MSAAPAPKWERDWLTGSVAGSGERDDAQQRTAPSTNGESDPGNWVVLVVDDDAAARKLVIRFLEKLRLRNPLVEAVDGEDAIAKLSEEANHPVLVLLDMQMPGRSGIEVLRWMRDQPRLRDVPVVVLSGFAELDDMDGMYALGIVSYLVKPVGFPALGDLLRQVDLPWMLMPPEAAGSP